MNCQLNIQRCLAILVVFLTLPQSLTLAQSTPPESPTNDYQLSFAIDRTLLPIKASDILDRDRGTAQWGNRQQLLEQPALNNYNTSRSVTRDLPQLWRMRVKPGDVGLLEAVYKISSNDGTVNPFNNVRLEPLPIQTIFTDTVSGSAVVQGGVRLTFINFANYRRTGDFSGRISVCVRRRGSNECL
jgi:hypothetical protein